VLVVAEISPEAIIKNDTDEKSGENRLPAEFGSWRVELG
jgi:hypothetical protein